MLGTASVDGAAMNDLFDLGRNVAQLCAFFPANSRHDLAVDLAATLVLGKLMLDHLDRNIVRNDPVSTFLFAFGCWRCFLLGQRLFNQLFKFANFKQQQLVWVDSFTGLAAKSRQQSLDRLLAGGQLFS